MRPGVPLFLFLSSLRLFALLGLLLSGLCPSSALAWERSRSSLGIPVRWASFPVSYWIGRQGSRDIGGGKEASVIHAAFQTWKLPCSLVSFTFQGFLDAPQAENSSDITQNQNVIFWVEPPLSWEFSSQTLAVTILRSDPFTGLLLDADILLNGHHLRWSIDAQPTAPSHDLQNTLTHEIGHLVGLEHSSDPDSTMYAEAPPAEVKKRDLADDDRQAICSIYGLDPDAGLTFRLIRQDDGLSLCPSSLPPRKLPLGPQAPPPSPRSSPPSSPLPSPPFPWFHVLFFLAVWLFLRPFLRPASLRAGSFSPPTAGHRS